MMRVLGAMLTCLFVRMPPGKPRLRAPRRSRRRGLAAPRAASPMRRCSSIRRRSCAGTAARSRSAARSHWRKTAGDETFGTIEATAIDARRQDRAVGRAGRHQGDEGWRCRGGFRYRRARPRRLPGRARLGLARSPADVARGDRAQAASRRRREPASARHRQHVARDPGSDRRRGGVEAGRGQRAGFSRVINTRALILRSSPRRRKCSCACTTAGSWRARWPVRGSSRSFRRAAWTRSQRRSRRRAWSTCSTAAGRQIRSRRLAQGIPAIYTSETPAELVVFKGTPEFAPIVGTLVVVGDRTRRATCCATPRATTPCWPAAGFAPRRSTGPGHMWRAMRCRRLRAHSADVTRRCSARCSSRHAASAQRGRREAQIPQTATVPRKGGPTFAAKYDGTPQFVDEPGTQLARAVNAAVPVIRAGNAYYAVKTGIWFTAAQPTGPWSVATSVPASDLRDPADFAHLLRDVRAHLRRHRQRRVRRLHAGISRRVRRAGRHGGVRHGLRREARGSAMRGIPRPSRTASRPRRSSIRASATRTHSRSASPPRAFSRRRAIPSGLLGPLPVLRVDERERLSRVVQAGEADKTRLPEAGAGDSGRDAGAGRRAARLQCGRRERVRELGSAGADPPHGTRARLRHVDDHQCGRRERRAGAAPRGARPTSPPTSITRASPRTAAGIRIRRPTTRTPVPTARCIASARDGWQQHSPSGWSPAPCAAADGGRASAVARERRSRHAGGLVSA